MVLRCFTTSEKVTNKKTAYHWCCKAPTYVDYAVVISDITKLLNNFFTGQFLPMFLNIKSKSMKQAQKYSQLSLFDDTEEKKAGTLLDQFEAPEEEQAPKRLKGGSQNPIVFHDTRATRPSSGKDRRPPMTPTRLKTSTRRCSSMWVRSTT